MMNIVSTGVSARSINLVRYDSKSLSYRSRVSFSPRVRSARSLPMSAAPNSALASTTAMPRPTMRRLSLRASQREGLSLMLVSMLRI